MKKFGVLFLAVAFCTTAFARGDWIVMHAKMSYAVLEYGKVMMTVTVPQNEYAALGRDMKVPSAVCRVKQVEPGANTTIVYLCTPE